MLPELLSPESFRDVLKAYPKAKQIHSDEARLVMRLYHYGLRFSQGSVDPDRDPVLIQRGYCERLWDHAETFLDMLETAARSPDSALFLRLVGAWNSLHLSTIPGPFDAAGASATAKRLVSLECSRFLKGADTAAERWIPYKNWADLLDETSEQFSHTIITFNYDLVPETLGIKGVVLPDTEPAPWPEPSILKLHGSVDWSKGADGKYETNGEDHCATCSGEDLWIATPGPGKQSSSTVFGSLWARAKQRLASADAVFFIGFRFPPSDAMARVKLLGSLRRSRAALHVVLGDDVNHPHCRRLKTLLNYVSGRDAAEVHPLFAEDFLGILDAHHLAKMCRARDGEVVAQTNPLVAPDAS